MTKIRLVPVREDGSIPPIPDDAIGMFRWFRGPLDLSSRGYFFYNRGDVAQMDKDHKAWAVEWIYE